MDELDIFIGGQWRRGGGNLMHSRFPADGSGLPLLQDTQDMKCTVQRWTIMPL